MPDHYHLLLKILIKNVLSKYISDVENSFSKYLNKKTIEKDHYGSQDLNPLG